MSQWQQLGSYGAQGYISHGAGGLGLSMRDDLDARRAAVGSIPSAAYPDGYLGTIQSRREDRLLDNVKQKLNDRSYQRGVHVGEKRSPQDYLWPADQQPDRGLQNQAYGIKTTPTGTFLERTVMTGLPGGAAVAMKGPLAELNPARASRLAHLAPSWR